MSGKGSPSRRRRKPGEMPWWVVMEPSPMTAALHLYDETLVDRLVDQNTKKETPVPTEARPVPAPPTEPGPYHARLAKLEARMEQVVEITQRIADTHDPQTGEPLALRQAVSDLESNTRAALGGVARVIGDLKDELAALKVNPPEIKPRSKAAFDVLDQQVLDVLNRYPDLPLGPPEIKRAMERFGITVTGSVEASLNRLKEAGKVGHEYRRNEGTARGFHMYWGLKAEKE